MTYYELYHHGVRGQRWGLRRWQNEDGSLTEAGKRHYDRVDDRWARRNSDKITRTAKRKSKYELRTEMKAVKKRSGSRKRNGQLTAAATLEFNRRMASIMSDKVKDIRSPSGRVISFVPERGTIGVFMAMSSPDYDMSKLHNGVWGSGRVAYKKTILDKMEY